MESGIRTKIPEDPLEKASKVGGVLYKSEEGAIEKQMKIIKSNKINKRKWSTIISRTCFIGLDFDDKRPIGEYE